MLPLKPVGENSSVHFPSFWWWLSLPAIPWLVAASGQSLPLQSYSIPAVCLCLHMEVTCGKQTSSGPAICFVSELSSEVSAYQRNATRPWFSAVGLLLWTLALDTLPPAHSCGSCRFLAHTNILSLFWDPPHSILIKDSQPAATVSPSCDCSLFQTGSS